jgi:spermidine/putrescine transport system substrate-binding protein
VSTINPQPTPAGMLETPISRRRALQIAAAAGAAAFLGGTTAARVAAQSPAAAPVTGSFKMATWIGYIDVGEDGISHPSLDRFTAETGVTVDYQESVNGNEEFFASQLQGPLQAGLSTGWDIVVLTDWMIQRLVNYGWLSPVDVAATPNYPANLLPIYQTREWDPGNLLAAPWQSGMTGIGYDQAVTGPLTNLDILFAEDYAGRLTYLSDPRDTVGLSALRLGTDPSTIDQAQWDAALAAVKTAIDSGIVRQVTGNSYVNDMSTGDVVVAIAWSGDVIGLLVPDQGDGQDFQWTLADQGGMLWTDNMAIPKGAANQVQAQVFINWYYDPANAAEIEAYVNYVCPVKGAAEAIVAIDPALATNTFIFPDEAMFARLYQFRSLDLDTASAWEAGFNQVAGL